MNVSLYSLGKSEVSVHDVTLELFEILMPAFWRVAKVSPALTVGALQLAEEISIDWYCTHPADHEFRSAIDRALDKAFIDGFPPPPEGGSDAAHE